MLETLMNLLNGEHGPEFSRALQTVFLAFLTVAALAVLFAPATKPGKTTYGLLRTLIVLSLCAAGVSGHVRSPATPSRTSCGSCGATTSGRTPPRCRWRAARSSTVAAWSAAPVPGGTLGRRYPLGEAAVHPLGYYHSKYGITAVERACDAALSGFGSGKGDEGLSKALFSAEEGGAVALNLDRAVAAEGLRAAGRQQGRRGDPTAAHRRCCSRW